MKPKSLSAAERHALKARAHALDPVVMIGDAGLTDGVMREIEKSLTAHELIKIRVAGDDRDERVALFERIATAVHAHPVQHIGKLLVLFRPRPDTADVKSPGTRTAAKSGRPAKTAERPKPLERAKSARVGREPVARKRDATKSTRVGAKKTTREVAVAPPSRPNRVERIRKSGQRSTKKAFQNH